MDFTACFEGNIRLTNPVMLNSILVCYAQVLAKMAEALHLRDESAEWQEDAARRAALIRQYCWNEAEGFFFEYQYVDGREIPVWSVNAYWTMWSDVATREQMDRLVANLSRFEHPHGLTFTDKVYPSPHPEFPTLQWAYPNGWPPNHIMIVEGLTKHGYREAGQRIAEKYVRMMVNLYQQTGKLWEKYNVVEGSTKTAVERSENYPFHGWSAAAAVVLGRYLFG